MGIVYAIVPAVEPVQLEHCATCAVFQPVSKMSFRDYYGGFYLCMDVTACSLRWHRDICAHLFRQTGRPNRFCVFCMAGTRNLRGKIRAALVSAL